jgi:hypothetical protein
MTRISWNDWSKAYEQLYKLGVAELRTLAVRRLKITRQEARSMCKRSLVNGLAHSDPHWSFPQPSSIPSKRMRV